MTVGSIVVDKKQQLKDFEKIMNPVQDLLQDLNELLLAQVHEFEPEVQELVKYVFANRGKQIRPMLVFYSGWTEDLEARRDLVRAAAVIEMIHLATLVHDDILDEAVLRHNSETLGIKFGSKQAVLLGDALFAHALKLAAEFPTVEVCRRVSESTRRVCCGEISQTFRVGERKTTIKDYYRIIDLKTAELFHVSCSLGGLLGGYSEDYIRALGEYGRFLGIAFQIYDDLVDLLGSEENIGKTLGTDFETGKHTLPLILLFEKLCTEVVDGGDLERLIFEYGIMEEIKSAFKEQIQKARACLLPFEDEPSCSYLAGVEGVMAGMMSRFD